MSSFWNKVSPKSIESAKNYLEGMNTDIPEKLLEKFWYSELEKMKYEFKKFLVHSVVQWKRNIFWVDGFDGSRKTSITTELTNPSTIYNNNIVRRDTLWIPSPKELKQPITHLYEKLFPWKWRTLFLDRSWNNRAFVQYLYEYCSPEQYEDFTNTLAWELERFLQQYDGNIKSLFFDIPKDVQKERLWERRDDPLRNHRYSPSDSRAIEMYDAIQGQREKIAQIYAWTSIPFTTVQTSDKKTAIIELLKYLLQDEDYDKKSKEIDFTPNGKIIQPTRWETEKILASKT